MNFLYLRMKFFGGQCLQFPGESAEDGLACREVFPELGGLDEQFDGCVKDTGGVTAVNLKNLNLIVSRFTQLQPLGLAISSETRKQYSILHVRT